MSCVCRHTRLTNLPTNDTHIELHPIRSHMHEISDQLLPKSVQEILKVSGINISKFEHYK